MTAMMIDVHSDIACPWCFIGTRRLESVIQSLDGEVEIEVRNHPYLLHPDAPPEGIDLQQMLRERYGADPRPMFARVEEAARGAGIPLDMSRQTRAYSTIAAHTLLRHASGMGTQSALADALFVAYFMDARNISDAAVLADVATQHGFTAAEVERLLADEGELALTRSEALEASRSGISGVPFFVLDDRYSLSGAQPAGVFRLAIAKALEPDPARVDATPA
ncbi:MAG: DsbA family oxidoreductase [Gemmatimonadaceae bacterium]